MRNFHQLLQRLHEMEGVPFREIAQAHSLEWSPERNRRKNLGGRLVETALGLLASAEQAPDLHEFDMELKTVPLGPDLSVREHTKITSLNPADVAHSPFEASAVFEKVRVLLIVPIVKHDLEAPDSWYIRAPFVWMPSSDQRRTLKQDYEQVQAHLRAGEVDALTSAEPPRGPCSILIPNTSGKNSKDTVRYTVSGSTFTMKRRAWMLRKRFVEDVVRQNLRYRLPAPPPPSP